MRRLYGRFTAVGVVVTVVDVAVLLLVNRWASLPVADLAALAAAGALSHDLHRRYTFADDPRARLVREPGVFVRVALVGGLIDLAVLCAAATQFEVLPAKVVAIAAAAAVRVVRYRRLVVGRVRTDQARKEGRPPPPGDVRFSVVIPAYKEGVRIAETIGALRAALPEGVEIVVVDDGSGDDTAEHARQAGADQVLVQPENKGKGAAVRVGMLAARGRTRAFTDADLAYRPAQLERLLREVETGWDVVVGSRRHVDTNTLVRARRLRELTGRYFNALTFLVLLGQYRDTQCGLKAFRSDAAERVFGAARIDGFAFDVEVFHLAERYRLSLTEVPVELANTTTSTVRVGIEALRMMRDLIRIRLLASSGAYNTPSD